MKVLRKKLSGWDLELVGPVPLEVVFRNILSCVLAYADALLHTSRLLVRQKGAKSGASCCEERAALSRAQGNTNVNMFYEYARARPADACWPLMHTTSGDQLLWGVVGCIAPVCSDLGSPQSPGLLLAAGMHQLLKEQELTKATLMAHAPYWAGKLACPDVIVQPWRWDERTRAFGALGLTLILLLGSVICLWECCPPNHFLSHRCD